MGRITEHFRQREFRVIPSMEVLMQMEEIREGIGKPITVKDSGSQTIDATLSSKTDKDAFSLRLYSLHNEKETPIYGKSNFIHNWEYLSNSRKFNSLPIGDKSALIALLQLGFPERNNNDNPYGLYLGINNQPWCAIFVHWVWKKAGVTNSIGSFASTRGNFNELPYVDKSIGNSQPGDAILFLKGHTGMIIFNSKVREYVYTVEGNISDKVVLRKYRYSELEGKLYGIGRMSPEVGLNSFNPFSVEAIDSILPNLPFNTTK